MTARWKLGLTIMSLLLVCVMSVCAIIVAFASTTHGFTSAISISYTATDVDGNISATYKVGATGTETPLLNQENEGVVYFDALDGQVTGSFLINDPITLTSDANYVEFKYSLNNTGSVKWQVTINFSDVEGDNTSNVSVTYSTNGSSYSSSPLNLQVAGNSSATCYVRIGIADMSLDTTYTGSLNIAMSAASN